jgi:hypothetical protein
MNTKVMVWITIALLLVGIITLVIFIMSKKSNDDGSDSDINSDSNSDINSDIGSYPTGYDVDGNIDLSFEPNTSYDDSNIDFATRDTNTKQYASNDVDSSQTQPPIDTSPILSETDTTPIIVDDSSYVPTSSIATSASNSSQQLSWTPLTVTTTTLNIDPSISETKIQPSTSFVESASGTFIPAW